MMRLTLSRRLAVTAARFALLCTVVTLAACAIKPRANSPDVIYSKSSSEARKLQVPPDLSSVSSGEQFVVPGNSGAVISRKTLLPVIESATFKRQGSAAWLEIQASPEALWPNLLNFIRQEGFLVSSTLPPVGLIETQWRERGGESGSLLSETADSEQVRLAFRMERLGESATRLFARLQTSSQGSKDSTALWDQTAAHPDKSSIVMQRLLVYLGLEEQRARGLLNAQVAESIMKGSELELTNAGSALLVHHGLNPSVAALRLAAGKLGASINRQNSTPNALNILDPQGVFSENQPSGGYMLLFSPQHVSKVSVSVADRDGGRISRAIETKILSLLQQALA